MNGRRTLDEVKWNDKLTAHVVEPGINPRIHGYDVGNDLVKHYSFIETVLLTFTGELPTREQAIAFDVIMQFIAPSPINEAPTHAAVLARTCGTEIGSIIGIASIALAEQARNMINRHMDWITQLTKSPYMVDDQGITIRNKGTLSLLNIHSIPSLESIGKERAIIATLHACGLKTPEQMQCAIVMTKLSSTMAEALATKPADVRTYPVHLPPLEYDV